MTNPLRQPSELLNMHRRPNPYSDLGDWIRAVAYGLGAVLHNQRVIYDLLVNVDRKEDAEMADLSAIQQAVQAETDATNAAVDLLQKLADELRNAATDPAQVQQLADQINQQAKALADAVVANTPAAPDQPTT